MPACISPASLVRRKAGTFFFSSDQCVMRLVQFSLFFSSLLGEDNYDKEQRQPRTLRLQSIIHLCYALCQVTPSKLSGLFQGSVFCKQHLPGNSSCDRTVPGMDSSSRNCGGRPFSVPPCVCRRDFRDHSPVAALQLRAS